MNRSGEKLINRKRSIYFIDLLRRIYIGNDWYLTGWCPQFESVTVLIPRKGQPLILGVSESEPFAKLDSMIIETRNFIVFMAPDEEYPNAKIIDFVSLFKELNAELGSVKRVGLVGAGRMPGATKIGHYE